jgi:hypothetical protein
MKYWNCNGCSGNKKATLLEVPANYQYDAMMLRLELKVSRKWAEVRCACA